MERRDPGVSSISIDSVDHNLKLVWLKEPPRVLGVFRKVDKDEIANDGNDDSEETFSDEDPAPSCFAVDTIHLLKTVRESASKSATGVA